MFKLVIDNTTKKVIKKEKYEAIIKAYKNTFGYPPSNINEFKEACELYRFHKCAKFAQR